MTITAKTTIKKGYLLVHASGTANTIQDTIDYANTYLAVANKNHLRCILADVRDVTTNFDYHDMVKLANYWDSIYMQSRGYRIADLPHPDVMEKYKQYETLSANRSFSYRVFESEEEALIWLLTP